MNIVLSQLNLSSFCVEAADILQYIGYALLIFKIAIPLIIVILAIIDFGGAVVASKEDEVKAKAKRLLWRVVTGLIIFFLPNIIIWIFSTIDEISGNNGTFKNCETCLLHPGDCSKS